MCSSDLMRFYRLIGLEIDALIKEHENTCANIYRYEDILEERSSMSSVISDELSAAKKAFSRERRTEIGNFEEAVFEVKAQEEMDVAFLMDNFGYVKTIDASIFEKNIEAVRSDFKYGFICKNTGKICMFTDSGQLHTVKVSELPQGRLRDKGIPIDNVSGYSSDKERVVYAAPQSSLNLYRMIFVTEQAMIKVVDGGEFDVSRKTVAATKLNDGDSVVSVMVLNTQKTIVFETEGSFFLRFMIDTIPEKTKTAVGVRGMKLSKNDRIKNVYYLEDADMHSIDINGKKLELGSLKIGNRDTKGTKK